MESVADILRRQVDALTEEKGNSVARLEGRLRGLVEDKERLTRLVETLEGEERNVVRQLRVALTAVDVSAAPAAVLTERIRELEARRSTLQQKVKGHWTTLVSETQSKAQIIRELEQRQANPEELRALEQRTSSLVAEINSLRESVQIVKNELTGGEAASSEHSCARAELDAALAQARAAQRLAAEAQDATDQAAVQLAEDARALAELALLTTEYEVAVGRMKEANSSSNVAVEDNKRLRDAAAALAEEKRRLTAEVAAAEARLPPAKTSDDMSVLRLKVEASLQQLAGLQAQLATAQKERDAVLLAAESARVDRSRLLAERLGFEAQLDVLARKAAGDAAESELASQSLAEISATRDALLAHMRELEAEAEAWRECDAENTRLSAEIAAMRHANAMLEQRAGPTAPTIPTQSAAPVTDPPQPL